MVMTPEPEHSGSVTPDDPATRAPQTVNAITTGVQSDEVFAALVGETIITRRSDPLEASYVPDPRCVHGLEQWIRELYQDRNRKRRITADAAGDTSTAAPSLTIVAVPVGPDIVATARVQRLCGTTATDR